MIVFSLRGNCLRLWSPVVLWYCLHYPVCVCWRSSYLLPRLIRNVCVFSGSYRSLTSNLPMGSLHRPEANWENSNTHTQPEAPTLNTSSSVYSLILSLQFVVSLLQTHTAGLIMSPSCLHPCISKEIHQCVFLERKEEEENRECRKTLTWFLGHSVLLWQPFYYSINNTFPVQLAQKLSICTRTISWTWA